MSCFPRAFQKGYTLMEMILVLTIISGLLVFSCYFTLIGLPSFIIGIIAMDSIFCAAA